MTVYRLVVGGDPAWLAVRVCAALVLSALAVGASSAEVPLIKKPGPLSTIDIVQLCNAVSDSIGTEEGSAYLRAHPEVGSITPQAKGFYQYEVILRSAAGVLKTDTADVIKSKMQTYWMAHRLQLKCSQLGFSIRGGNIAKLAFERDSRPAINDFIRRWNLDMNFVDPADGKTLLDYMDARVAETESGPMAASVRQQRDLLVRHGARRRSEL